MALGGHFLSSKDYVDAICDGLTIESDSFVVSISSRIGSYTKEEIESLLVAQEARIVKNNKKNNKALDFAPSANIAAKFQGQGNSKKW